MRAPDVAIVGGGIVGAATAAFLAAAGARVTLYERTEIAAGASGRNSGVIQHPFDPVLVALYRRSLASSTADLARGAPGRVPARRRAERAAVDRDGRGRRCGRPDRRRVDRRRIPRREPEIVAGRPARRSSRRSPPDLVACRLEIGYPVAPASATRAYATARRARGATVRIGAERPWRWSGGRGGRRAWSMGGLSPPGAVVVAAGPWTPADRRSRPAVASRSAQSGASSRQVDLAEPPRHVLEEIDIEIEPGDEPSDRAAAEGGLGFSLVTADGASALGSTFLARASREPDGLASCSPRPRSALRARDRERAGRGPAQLRPAGVARRPPARRRGPGHRRGAFVAAGNGPWGISTGPGDRPADRRSRARARPAIPAALDPARFGPVALLAPPRSARSAARVARQLDRAGWIDRRSATTTYSSPPSLSPNDVMFRSS